MRSRKTSNTALVCCCLAAAAFAGPGPAQADTDQVYLFLRNNHIYLRVPDGPTYRAIVDSPVYEEYAGSRVTDCAAQPQPTSRKPIEVYYKTGHGPQFGAAEFELLVNPRGAVAAVQIRKSPGGYALYSALKAIQEWTFGPGTDQAGAATWCRYQLRVNFVEAKD